jgi:hypothetical protein
MKPETNTETLNQAEAYLELYGTIRDRVGDEQVAVAVMHELSKDRRMQQIREERQMKLPDFEQEGASSKPRTGQRMASKKQLDFLRDLGGEVKAGMTSEEASQAIDSAQARQRTR